MHGPTVLIALLRATVSIGVRAAPEVVPLGDRNMPHSRRKLIVVETKARMETE